MKKHIPVSLVLFAGICLRLYRLDWQSIEHDEIFSLTVSHKQLPEMMRYLVADFVQPPLHYFVLRGWFHVFGFSVYSSRFVSVLFGRYLFNEKTALLAAAFLAVSQLGIQYSQEARPYAQLLFLILCASYLFLFSIRTGRLWWVLVGLVILALYTHYYACFAVASFLLFAFIYRERYHVAVWNWKWMSRAGIIAAVYAPWVFSGIIGAWLDAKKVSVGHHRIHVIEGSAILLGWLNKFNNGKLAGIVHSAPWWGVLAGGILFVVPVLISVTDLTLLCGEERERENLAFLLILLVLPMVSCVVVGQLIGQIDVRYALFSIAPYYLLAARGIFEIKPKNIRWAIVAACLLYSLASLRSNYFIRYKEDYQSAYAYLARTKNPDDCYAFTPPWNASYAEWAWTIYHGSVLSNGQCSRTWLISVSDTANPIFTRAVEATQARVAKTQTKVEDKNFFWTHLYLYVPKS